MKWSLLLLMTFLFTDLMAQRPNTVYLEAGGNLIFQRRTTNELVPTGRQKKSFGVADAFVTSMFAFKLKEGDFQYKAGLGYRSRHFDINHRFPDNNPYPFIVPGNGGTDTISIYKTSVTSKYLDVPFGFTVRLSKGTNKTIEVYGGIQFNNSIRLSSSTEITRDGNSVIPTKAQKSFIEDKYSSTSSGLLLSLQPRLDMRLRIAEDFGMTATLLPIVFYYTSSNPKLMRNGSGIVGAFGFFQDF